MWKVIEKGSICSARDRYFLISNGKETIYVGAVLGTFRKYEDEIKEKREETRSLCNTMNEEI